MQALSTPWLGMATLMHTSLSLMAGLAAWEEKAATAAWAVTAETGPMAEMELPAAAKSGREEAVAMAAMAVTAEVVATAARGELEAMERRLRFRFRSMGPSEGSPTLAE
jgi:hypothetical protein